MRLISFSATRLLIAVGLLTVTCGCGRNPVKEVPGHLKPGTVRDVHSQINQATAGESIEAMSLKPVRQHHQSNIPVVTMPEHAFIWFSATLSEDKESLRWDHWATVRVREAGFVEEQWMSDAIYLNSLDDYQLDSEGNVVGRTMGPAAALPNPIRHGDTGAWIPATDPGQQQRVTVLEVQGNQIPRLVNDTRVPVAPGSSNQRYEDLIRQYAQTAEAASGVVPSTAPVAAPTTPRSGSTPLVPQR